MKKVPRELAVAKDKLCEFILRLNENATDKNQGNLTAPSVVGDLTLTKNCREVLKKRYG